MKRLKILLRIMKQTGADRFLIVFVVFYIICAFIIWLREPQIETLGDALWYCFAVISTIGFGDVLVTTFVARIVSVILSIYAVLVISIATGVVVNYYTQLVNLRQSETITAVIDRLEHLPEMSVEELEELSETIKHLHNESGVRKC